MAKNEDGEFELVVGNRQLLSIVFILMVLFGVVFTMGYFVGRNSAPEAASAAGPAQQSAAETSSSARPEPVAGVAQPAAPPSGGEAAPPESEQSKPGGGGTQPVAVPSEQTAQQTTPPSQPPAAETNSASPLAGSREVATRGAQTVAEGQPALGETFLQVAAVKRAEAEVVADVLKTKGFRAIITPVPNETLFRVLVGPLRDSATLVKTKADLEKVGFRSIIRKY